MRFRFLFIFDDTFPVDDFEAEFNSRETDVLNDVYFTPPYFWDELKEGWRDGGAEGFYRKEFPKYCAMSIQTNKDTLPVDWHLLFHQKNPRLEGVKPNNYHVVAWLSKFKADDEDAEHFYMRTTKSALAQKQIYRREDMVGLVDVVEQLAKSYL